MQVFKNYFKELEEESIRGDNNLPLGFPCGLQLAPMLRKPCKLTA